MPQSWSSLTRRGQARRLAELARVALRAYDLEVQSMRLVLHAFNCTFRVTMSSGASYALRINRPDYRTEAAIQTEMAWMAALHRDTPIRLPKPLNARDGRLVVQASAPGVPEPRFCAVFSWLPGTLLSKSATPDWLYKAGELTAQLHAHTDYWHPAEPETLPAWTGLLPFARQNVLFAPDELMPPARTALFRAAAERVEAALARRTGDALRLLHGDLHLNNLMGYRGQIGVLDFDDCLLGYPVQDVGISLYYLLHNPEYPALRAAYQAGYTALRPWPEAYPGEVDAFIAGRALMLSNFVLLDYRDAAERILQRNETFFRAFL